MLYTVSLTVVVASLYPVFDDWVATISVTPAPVMVTVLTFCPLLDIVAIDSFNVYVMSAVLRVVIASSNGSDNVVFVSIGAIDKFGDSFPTASYVGFNDNNTNGMSTFVTLFTLLYAQTEISAIFKLVFAFVVLQLPFAR